MPGTASEEAKAVDLKADDESSAGAAGVLMALGLIGTGLLAVPILTGSAAYAVCETLGWKCSLDARPARAKELYCVIGASTVGGLLINSIGINTIDALFWTAVINGLLSPPLLVVILLIANNRRIMGQRANGWWENLLGWTTAVVMSAAVGFLLTWGGSR
jgi:Mn2+/Fe2+ NRAMP family transporter